MKNFSLAWFYSLAFKLVFAFILPLTTDEAYYWVWGQKPQLSYFDHPPMVAWLFWLGHFLENFISGDSAIARWPAVILGHCTLLVWFFIWKDLFPQEEKKFRWWFWLVLFSPLIGFGSLIVTPDLPVIFFWSLSTFFFIRCLAVKSISHFACFGAALGLGFLSKYHIALFLPLALLFLSIEKKWAGIRTKHILTTFVFGLIFSSPVLIWNYQNNFTSFLFQLHHGLGQDHYEPFWTLSYLLAQVLIIFPVVFYFSLKSKPVSTQRLLYYLGWGPLVFFFFSSFRGAVEVNWPIIAYPSLFALAVIASQKIKPLLFSMIFWLSLFLIFTSHLLYPWLPVAPNRLSEFSLYEPVLKIRNKYSPLYAGNYQMASWVWYETKKPFFKLINLSRKDFFDSFPEAEPQGFPVYVVMPDNTPLPPWIEEKGLEVSEIEKLPNSLVVVKIGYP